jgi:hypothetical protein
MIGGFAGYMRLAEKYTGLKVLPLSTLKPDIYFTKSKKRFNCGESAQTQTILNAPVRDLASQKTGSTICALTQKQEKKWQELLHQDRRARPRRWI